MQETQESYLLWIDRAANVIEGLAVALILAFIIVATLSWLRSAARKRAFVIEDYSRYRNRLGRALLLGLEILVAADIVRTVALRPTLASVAALGMLVAIRTFLSWSIVVEVEGRWPWQAGRTPEAGQKDV
ncbi:MAG: DUF1622 domain-containing protein [Steroidobacteraceae bacterium]|nr:DUF1622 domain-containing protein [Steroidobacteraceae bacterium]